MFSYDAALLAALEPVPRSIADVLQILAVIESTCVDEDGLKWFNWLYRQMTEAVEERVAAGGFSDCAWMAELDVQFAMLYFSALRSWLRGGGSPGCWQALLQSRERSTIARIQFALAGVNAHINHDLPQAIVTTCQITGTLPDACGSQYDDYTALNSTLDSLIESAKRGLNVRLPGDALPPISRLDDTIAAWNINAARESAWRNGQHLWQLRTLPLLAGSFMEVLDGLTTVIGKTLLVPVP